MKPNDFITIFRDIIQSDVELDMDSQLKAIEEWDSLAIMATIAYFDVRLGVDLVFDDFQHMRTVRDIAVRVPGMEA